MNWRRDVAVSAGKDTRVGGRTGQATFAQPRDRCTKQCSKVAGVVLFITARTKVDARKEHEILDAEPKATLRTPALGNRVRGRAGKFGVSEPVGAASQIRQQEVPRGRGAMLAQLERHVDI